MSVADTHMSDSLTQHILSGSIADDRGWELHVDVEHSLGRAGWGTGGVHQLGGGVLGGAPEALGTTSIEVWHLRKEWGNGKNKKRKKILIK